MKLNQLFSSPLGAQVAPIGSFRPKCSATAAAIATGIGMGVGSLASAYANLKNQADTNEANREINRENLAWQKEQWKQQQENFKLQRKWQLEDTASERNWNSVQAQVGRYRAAGLNPSLAMYGGAGQNQVQTGTVNPTAPSGSYPGQQLSMNPAQINLEGLGMSVGSAMQSYYQAKSEQRSDYALASQIEVDHMNAQANMMNASSKAKEAGLSEKWINKQVEIADRNYLLEQDKFKAYNDYNNAMISIEQQRIDQGNRELQIKEAALANDIRLSSAQISQIAALINESKKRVDNMAAEQDLNYKEYQRALKNDLFNMKARLLEIGISEEQMKSQKFKDFFGTIANSVIAGVGAYYGVKGFKSVHGKVQPKYDYSRHNMSGYQYNPVEDTPWNRW